MKKNHTRIDAMRRMRNRARKHSGQEAFTLIELLVVVAIIGLLSAVIMFSVTNAREKAYDTKRVEDLRQLQIAAELRLLENVPIPTVTYVIPSQYAQNDEGGVKVPSVKTIVKYVTMTPNTADADAAQFAASAKYYKDLFANGLFFKAGAPMPQDPQCINPTAATPDPNTCYRAYYNTAANTLVIATTLRTKKHTSGLNVQYGIAAGKGVNTTTFATTCQAIGYPVFDASIPVNFTSACADPGGVSSIVNGMHSGRNVTGSAGGTGSI